MLTDRGTHAYTAPEIRFGRSWNERVDIWACGLCLFFMLEGRLPFDCNSQKVRRALLSGKLPEVVWDGISELGRNLTEQCLTVQMRDRPTAMELLLHPFFDQDTPSSPQARTHTSPSSSGDGVHMENTASLHAELFEHMESCGLVAVIAGRLLSEGPPHSQSARRDAAPEWLESFPRAHAYCLERRSGVDSLARLMRNRCLRTMEQSSPKSTSASCWHG